MTPTEELRKRLDELGVEYDTFDPISTQNTYWNVGELRYRYCGRKDSMTELTMFAKCGITPEQAIAATVDGTVCEPSKEWKAWHESLKHDNPTDIREAVENILFDAIDFGSNMGPNGNVWSGVDEGDALTEKCIDEWVRSIESVAETVGVEPIECEPDGWYKCPKCGCVVGYDELYGGGWSIFMDDYQIPFKYCPNCGRKVLD